MSFQRYTLLFADSLIQFDEELWPVTQDDIEDFPQVFRSSTRSPPAAAPQPSHDAPVAPSSAPTPAQVEAESSNSENEDAPQPVPKKGVRVLDPPTRLDGSKRHKARKVKTTERRRCRVCFARGGGKKRKDTRNYCLDCKVFMCDGECFEDYHSLRNYMAPRNHSSTP